MQQMRSFFDHEKAEAVAGCSHAGDVESLTVIGNRQRPLAVSLRQHHMRTAGARMSGDVAQRFLGSPKQAHRFVGCERHEVFAGAEGDLDAVPMLELGTMELERGLEPDLVQSAPMQLVRETSNRVRQPHRLVLKRRQRCFQRGMIVSGDASSESAEREGQPGELLADLVVQFARDAFLICFLGHDQAAGELLCASDTGGHHRLTSTASSVIRAEVVTALHSWEPCNAKLLHPASQRARFEPQQLRCTSGPFDAPSHSLEDEVQVVALGFSQRPHGGGHGRWAWCFDALTFEVVQVQHTVPGQDDRPLKGILELADVPRPVMLGERLQ